MPTYNITDPNTGKNIRITGDSPPTEEELNEIFSQLSTTQKPQYPPKGASFKPSGEMLTPERRKEEGKVIAEEQITPILEGVGATIGGAIMPGLGAVPGAGLGYAVGEKLGDLLGGEPVKPLSEEAKEFGKEAVKGAALEYAGGKIAKGVAWTANKVASKLYESAVKFSTKLGMAKRTEQTKKALDNFIFITDSGLKKLEGKIKQANSKIDKAIRISTKKDTVNTATAVKHINAAKRLFKNDENAKEILGILDDYKNQLLKEHGPTMSARKAQEMKTLLYRKLDKAYGEMKDFSKEGKKAFARGLRQELERIYPQLKELNKEHAALRGLDRSLESAVGRVRNRELFSLLATTTTGVGGAVHEGSVPEGLKYALMMQLLVSPNTKAGVAMALNAALKSSGGLTQARRALGPLLINSENKTEEK